MEEAKGDNKRLNSMIPVIIWGIFIVWRLIIYFSYCVNYTDDDQALMWYGTVHFAHGHFPEPCFFGQDYGSMLESLLAVPLYLLGWPLNYALPLVTGLLYVSAFVFCSMWLWKKGKRTAAMTIMLVPVWTGWQCDILTSIPRSLISGLPFAVIGLVLLCDDGTKILKEAAGVMLLAFGCVQSQTAFALAAAAVAYILLYSGNKIRKTISVLAGSALALVLIMLEKKFYTDNPFYHLHVDISFSVKGSYLKDNLSELSELMGDFFAVKWLGIVAIPLLAVTFIVLGIVKKKFREVLMAAGTVAGCLLLLCTEKSTDYVQGSVLYGQSRIFLFLPYLIVMFIVLINGNADKENSLPENKAMLLIAALCLTGIVLKGISYAGAFYDENSALYNDSGTDPEELVVGIMPVKELLAQAELADALAMQYGVKAVSLRNGVVSDPESGTIRLPYKSLAYVSGAVYYDRPYDFFLPLYDRRTWVYEKMAYDTGGKMLLIRYPVKDAEDLLMAELLPDESPVAWFITNHGMHRNYLDYYTGEF